MHYDSDLDATIVQMLYPNKRLSFHDLASEVGKHDQIVSRHLEKLLENHILTRDVKSINGKDWKVGMKRFYFLTDIAKTEYSLGILEAIKTGRQIRRPTSETNQQKLRKMYQLVMLFSRIGTHTWPESKSGRRPGFSITDLMTKEIVRISTQQGMFAYLQFSRSELESMVKDLLKFNPPLLKAIDEVDGEIRYAIADAQLADCMFDLSIIFTEVLGALLEELKYRLPTTEEFAWYRFFYGESRTRLDMTDLLEKRRKMLLMQSQRFPKLGEKKILRLLQQEARRQSKENSRMILEMRIQYEERHTQTIQKYNFLFKELDRYVVLAFLA